VKKPVPKTHPFAIQRRILRENGVTHPVIWDVGARAGEPTISYLKTMPRARVLAWEPDPIAVQELETQFKNEKRVKVIPLALTDFDGKDHLYLHGGGTNSLLPRAEGPVYYPPLRTSGKTIRVGTATADRHVEDFPDDRPDILKLDTQGSELRALFGAFEILQTVKAIYCEVSFVPIYQGGPMYHHIAQFVEDAGFRLFRLYFPTHAKDGQLRQADALFINTRYEKGEKGD
jgi:FkbM family methyltransferase